VVICHHDTCDDRLKIIMLNNPNPAMPLYGCNMILSFFYLLGILVVLAHASGAPQVKIGKTTLVGLSITEAKLDFFGGEIFPISLSNVQRSRLFFTAIPFAKPPLGSLRLQPPVLQTQLDVRTFDASSFGPGCLQAVRRFMVSPIYCESYW
jgi:hypothetical protein